METWEEFLPRVQCFIPSDSPQKDIDEEDGEGLAGMQLDDVEFNEASQEVNQLIDTWSSEPLFIESFETLGKQLFVFGLRFEESFIVTSGWNNQN